MASRSGDRRPGLSKAARGGRPDLVADALRQLWANAENDPVPDDFLALLDRLDAAGGSAPTNEDGAGKPEGRDGSAA